MTPEELVKYHYDNYYGMESDQKIHKAFYLYEYNKNKCLYDQDFFKSQLQNLLFRIGSLNSREFGQYEALLELIES